MLSWSRVGFGTSSYGSLVVNKYPNGIGAGVRLYLFSGMCHRLQDSKELCITNFDMFFKVLQSLRVGVICMDCNQTSTIGSCSSCKGRGRMTNSRQGSTVFAVRGTMVRGRSHDLSGIAFWHRPVFFYSKTR